MEWRKHTSSVEDYLEAILKIEMKHGRVRIKDIAEELRVTAPSVTGMIRKLSDLGYVYYERYGIIHLTDRGRQIAEDITRRHDLIEKLLIICGVNREIAHEDACKIEHACSSETLYRLERLVEFLSSEEIYTRFRRFKW